MGYTFLYLVSRLAQTQNELCSKILSRISNEKLGNHFFGSQSIAALYLLDVQPGGAMSNEYKKVASLSYLF